MTILYRPGKLHGNADPLSRIDTRPCPCEDCPDNGHLIMKVKTPSEKKPRSMCVIQMRSAKDNHDLDNFSELVPLLSDY